MVLDATLLNMQHYKAWIKGKVKQSKERSSAPPLHLSVVAIEKGAFMSPSTTVTNFTLLLYVCKYMWMRAYLSRYIKVYMYVCIYKPFQVLLFWIQSGYGSNVNEGLHHNPLSFRTGTLPSDAI